VAEAWKLWLETVWRQERVWGRWTPDRPIRIGDVGEVHGHEFERATDLGNLGIEFEVLTDASKAVRKSTLAGVARFEVKADVTAGDALFPNVPAGKAGVRLEFGSDHAVVYVFRGCRTDEIDDVVGVARAARAHPDWRKEYFIVTSVVTADVGTVLISTQKNSAIVLSAEAEVSAAIETLADASLGLKRTSGTELALEILAEGPFTPFFSGGYATGPYRPGLPGSDDRKTVASSASTGDGEFTMFSPLEAGLVGDDGVPSA
jgi:hypothetical protein